MTVRIALWSLAGSLTGIGELRERLATEWLPQLARIPGLTFAAVVSDELGDRWGTVSVWSGDPVALPGEDAFDDAPDILDELVLEGAGAGGFTDERLGGRGRVRGTSELLRIALWRHDTASAAALHELRIAVEEEGLEGVAATPGLRWHGWVSDEAEWARFGEVSLWETPDAALAPAPGGTAQLIGRHPDIVEEFDVEATVSGLDD